MKEKISNVLKEVTSGEKGKKNGAWAISCAQSFFTRNQNTAASSTNYRVPSGTGTSIMDSISKFSKLSENIYSEDKIFIDPNFYPHNTGCNGVCPDNCAVCLGSICQ